MTMPEHAMTQNDPSWLVGGNASFLEGLYEEYLIDPSRVDAAWHAMFSSWGGGREAGERPHGPVQQEMLAIARAPRVAPAATPVHATPGGDGLTAHGISALIQAHRTLGHLRARTNPLDLRTPVEVPELDPAYHGLSDATLDIPVKDGGFEGPLRTVLEQCRATYCGPIGFEYAYVPRREREWLQARIEATRGTISFAPDKRKRILAKVNAAEGLEKYLHQRYVGQKRFSLEGGDSLIPLLDAAYHRAGALGVKEIVLGMAHRGRLNVLVNLYGKKSSILFSEFEGTKRVDPNISGDVKYHLGFSSDLATEGGSVHLALAFNPSHLEIINPVVEGSVRARQDRRGDLAHRLVLPVQVHGDAALAGQGVVAETLNLSCLRGFETGGTLHVVINNQVGFSISDPLDARTGHYCTDVAKMIDAPVLHVNGDDPEACVWAAELALDYRATFHRDVFIDLVCWRRYGHNESDEPRVTQPGMYHQIDAHPGVLATYARRLEAEGVVSADEVRHMQREYRDALDRGDRVAEAGESDYISIHGAPWKPYIGQTWQAPATTGVPASMLRDLGQALTRLPEGFQLHPRIQRIINQRIEMTEGQLPIDWGFAENLAYASLLSEGFPVRLCGQDAGRGTFFHRHVALHDQSRGGAPEGRIHLPLQHLQANQAWFQVIDSTLSEEGVLGFEYGYTSTEPKVMVIWEAQYGDFANGAQAVIDQFISAGELKWQRLSGLVMFLPHGFEGQGPEHSSARLERYLQLCAEENMQVVVPSTPAQMFHMLRRQMIRPYRKPLIVMTPKSLLRHKLSVSTLEELAHGRFQEVIRDDRSTEGIQRVVVCSGKVYFELIEAREGRKLEHVALVRLEQLYPFPDQALRAELARYPGATVVWTQEEPENQGAWRETRDALKGCLRDDQMLTLASRPCSASPAVGSAAKHLEQQKNLIDAALGEAVPSALGAVGSR